MEFSRQEYWSGLPFPSPGDLPNPGIELMSPALEADSLLSEPLGKPKLSTVFSPQLFGKLSQRNCTCAPKLLSWTGGSDGKKKNLLDLQIKKNLVDLQYFVSFMCTT